MIFSHRKYIFEGSIEGFINKIENSRFFYLKKAEWGTEPWKLHFTIDSKRDLLTRFRTQVRIVGCANRRGGYNTEIEYELASIKEYYYFGLLVFSLILYFIFAGRLHALESISVFLIFYPIFPAMYFFSFLYYDSLLQEILELKQIKSNT